ncbi:MAG: DNA replication and repair protein RecF [Spirochaetaceae bacterium]|jgi:DNA replication and repair protein RecF|nr:DNA replication and repair protein RecF [Spirochaetaceae bacterium]
MFESIKTYNFRNLENSEIFFGAKNIFLVGENGQGKSNFLEALYFCSYASSFRGAKDAELCLNGEKSCSVIANLGEENITVKIERGKKAVEINGKKTADRKELLQHSPCIVFCHEDMAFVTGSPEDRRWFFDQCISLYDELYLDDLRKYKHILKMRNNVFKNKEYGTEFILNDKGNILLDSLDAQLAQYGLNIMLKREESAKRFSEIFTPLYQKVANIDDIKLVYTPSWKNRDIAEIIEHQKMRRQAEKATGMTLSGPHRDKYMFMQADEEFSAKASTGQRRLLALLLRIAEALCFSEKTGKKPVLLLDDVLLELDGEKRKRFLQVLPDYNQAFFTFLPEEPVESYLVYEKIIFNVSSGKIQQNR